MTDRPDLTDPAALEPVAARIARDGFARVEAAEMRALAPGLAEVPGFAATWDDLGVDTYMADGGRYRRRRHAAFSASAAGIARKPHQPHYQSRDYNALNGGIERWFAPVSAAAAEHPVLRAVLAACDRLFTGLTPEALRPAAWHVEVHQFRIEAQPGVAGKPTPEGMHRDGVDFVLVLLIRRENVAHGETSIHDLAGRHLGSFTLREPLDAAIVDDSRVYHGVTPVEPLDPVRPAYRDVLVVTFRRQ